MAGEIQLNGTNFASESSGTITVNNGTLGSSVVFPTGHVTGFDYAEFTGVQTVANAALVDITNLSCSLTITSGSKVLVMAHVFCGVDQNSYGQLIFTDSSNSQISPNNTTGTGSQVNTTIPVAAYGNTSNEQYHTEVKSMIFYYTPSSTSVTVKVRGRSHYVTNMYINRPANTDDAAHHTRGISTLTIMEIAQ